MVQASNAAADFKAAHEALCSQCLSPLQLLQPGWTSLDIYHSSQLLDDMWLMQLRNNEIVQSTFAYQAQQVTDMNVATESFNV